MAEEIVRIIKVDTKNSGKSIKDLRNEIKSLRQELEKTEVGSKEFESTLKQLTQTQKSYNEVQQQIRDLSRTNQQDMVKFASFARNLGKSYSALNAAIGLFADKNEDVQKAMLKVQRTIQLVQGLDGIAGLIRDIPKVINGFKSWLTALNPIEREVDRIAKGINGINPNTLRAINEANRAGQGGAAAAAAAGGSTRNIEIETEAMSQQTKVITALNAARDELQGKIVATKQLVDEEKTSLAAQKDALSKAETELAKYEKQYDGLLTAYNQQKGSMSQLTIEAQKANQQMIEQGKNIANIWDPAVKKYSEAVVQLGNMKKELTATESNITATKKSIDITKASIQSLNASIAENEAVLEKDQASLAKLTAQLNGTSKAASKLGSTLKTIGKTVGWTLIISAAVTLVLKLLDSMGLTIDAFWDWITGANNATKAQRAFNKEISEGTNQAASKQIVVLKELSLAYSKLGDSAEKKKEFLQKYSDKIKETGLSIDDLKKAEDVFINNTDQYVNAIMARAKAQATENAAVKIYEDYLNERYDLEQKYEKNKNKAAGTNSKDSYIALLKASGMSAEEAEAAWNTATNRRQQRILNQIDAADKKVQDRLKKMFEDVAKLEQEYAGMFTSVTSSSGGASTDWAAQYKEALEALRNYVQDYLDIFKDARTKELDDNRKAYEENVKSINENFLKGVEAAQGNAKKLLELEDEKNKALHLAQLAYERRRLEIIDKYNDEVFEKQKAELDREYSLLEKQLERNRRLYDTTNLREPKQVSYQTTYNQNPLPFGLGRNWMNVYQTKEQVEKQYRDQVKYNDEFLKLTQDRINNENKLLQDEIDTITNKAKVLQEQLNSTDLNDLDKRREIVDQLADLDNTLFTNRQTIAENEIALDNAVLENQQANLDAYLDMQDKKKQALDGVLEVASNAAGALANIFRMEMNNDKLSQQQRERALKAYKAFAITQAIADTWKGANEAYAAMASIPYVGPALGIAASAAAVAMGLANVKAIMSESISSSSQTASVNAPAPMDTAPIEYSRNLVGDKELDQLNKPIKCYVLESEITDTQNKVKVTETNATF